MRLVALACLIAACSGIDAPAELSAVAVAVTAPPITRAPPPLTAPHGERIAAVAITDRADAALTMDEAFELRLWPTLDGAHEPVVVHGPRAVQLALGRAPAGLYAAILDPAGNVSVLRFTAAGQLVGRAQITGPIAQVVAVPGGLVVRRADQQIERFDPRGARTGTLVPAAGERVVSLAARRDHVIAGLGDASGATTVRPIAFAATLSWGPRVRLPEPLAELALSPDGQRVAGVAHGETGQIVALAPPAVLHRFAIDLHASDDPHAPPDPAPRTVTPGFLDDTTCVFALGAGQLAWFAGPAWAAADGELLADDDSADADELAITDHLIGSSGAALALADRHRVRYLGYRWLGAGLPADRFRDGHRAMLETTGGWIAIDRALDPDISSLDAERVLDGHHSLFLRAGHVIIRNLLTHTDTEIASGEFTLTRFDAATGVLGLATADHIVRYRLAFPTPVAPVIATELPTLAMAGLLRPFFLTDPAIAHGVVAVVAGMASDALVYRLGGPPGPLLWPHEVALASPLVTADRAGAMYTSERRIAAISHDGESLVTLDATGVTVQDRRGDLRWRRLLARPYAAVWSDDDQTLFVAAEGGAALSFTAAGAPIAIRCGWGFGVSDIPLARPARTPSACAADRSLRD
jgi:hypothetical protein